MTEACEGFRVVRVSESEQSDCQVSVHYRCKEGYGEPGVAERFGR